MKITLDNWDEVRNKILKLGIAHAEYDYNKKLHVVITKSGEQFEFSPEAFDQFKNADLLQRGKRIDINS